MLELRDLVKHYRVGDAEPVRAVDGASLSVAPGDCWYVGDNYDRDVLCGRRAGVGGNILMEARKTYEPPYDLDLRPDAIVADPVGLLALFDRMTGEVAA